MCILTPELVIISTQFPGGIGLKGILISSIFLWFNICNTPLSLLYSSQTILPSHFLWCESFWTTNVLLRLRINFPLDLYCAVGSLTWLGFLLNSTSSLYWHCLPFAFSVPPRLVIQVNNMLEINDDHSACNLRKKCII